MNKKITWTPESLARDIANIKRQREEFEARKSLRKKPAIQKEKEEN